MKQTTEELKDHIAEQYRFISDLEDAITSNGDLINRLSKERDEFATTIANFARNEETNLADLCCKSSDVINKIKADAIREAVKLYKNKVFDGCDIYSDALLDYADKLEQN